MVVVVVVVVVVVLPSRVFGACENFGCNFPIFNPFSGEVEINSSSIFAECKDLVLGLKKSPLIRGDRRSPRPSRTARYHIQFQRSNESVALGDDCLELSGNNDEDIFVV